MIFRLLPHRFLTRNIYRYPYGDFAAVPISNLVAHLRVDFPTMSTQIIERALVDCGYDIEATIRKLDELRLSSVEKQPVPLEDASFHEDLPVNGAEWVELLVNEMTDATSIDDAKRRAARVLEGLEKSINAENFQKCMNLKEKNDVLLQENACLKRAVVVFAKRQKDYDTEKIEIEQLKQMVDQYKSQLSAVEVKNYGLTLYLQKAQQQSNSMHGCFPDVF